MCNYYINSFEKTKWQAENEGKKILHGWGSSLIFMRIVLKIKLFHCLAVDANNRNSKYSMFRSTNNMTNSACCFPVFHYK